jgi:hypothetical protein
MHHRLGHQDGHGHVQYAQKVKSARKVCALMFSGLFEALKIFFSKILFHPLKIKVFQITFFIFKIKYLFSYVPK